jgi:hypothetical protein
VDRVPPPLQRPGNAFDVLDPAAAVAGEVVEREVCRAELERVRTHMCVIASTQSDPQLTVDRDRQHEAVVVVGVLANEVDAPRRTDHQRRDPAESLGELALDPRPDAGVGAFDHPVTFMLFQEHEREA